MKTYKTVDNKRRLNSFVKTFGLKILEFKGKSA